VVDFNPLYLLGPYVFVLSMFLTSKKIMPIVDFIVLWRICSKHYAMEPEKPIVR
jgi:hypothetical protein